MWDVGFHGRVLMLKFLTVLQVVVYGLDCKTSLIQLRYVFKGKISKFENNLHLMNIGCQDRNVAPEIYVNEAIFQS